MIIHLKSPRSAGGFTLLEVLFAAILISVAILSFVSAQGGSVKLTSKADEVTKATMLAQQKLTEFEQKFLKEGFKELDSKLEGEFDQDLFPSYHWKVELKDSGIDLLLNMGGEEEEATPENQPEGIQKQIMEAANKFLKESLQLMQVYVYWGESDNPKALVLETYIAKLDIPITPPSLNSGGP